MTQKTLAPPKTQTFSVLTLLAILATYLFWGGSYVAIRVAVQTMPPLLLNSVRFFLAGGILTGILWQRGERLPSLVHLRNGVVIGTLLFVGGLGLVSISSQWVESGLAALAVAVIPIWITLLALLVENTRPTRQQTAGLVLGFVGIVVLNLGEDFGAESLGAVLLFFAPMLWAIGSILMRNLALPDGLMGTATMMLGGAVGLLVVGLLRGETFTGEFPLQAIFAWVYLVVAGSLLAFTAYTYLLKTTKPVIATSYAYVNPMVTVFLGWLILDEQLSTQTFIAAAIIVPSIVLITTSRED